MKVEWQERTGTQAIPFPIIYVITKSPKPGHSVLPLGAGPIIFVEINIDARKLRLLHKTI